MCYRVRRDIWPAAVLRRDAAGTHTIGSETINAEAVPVTFGRCATLGSLSNQSSNSTLEGSRLLSLNGAFRGWRPISKLHHSCSWQVTLHHVQENSPVRITLDSTEVFHNNPALKSSKMQPSSLVVPKLLKDRKLPLHL